MRKDVDGARWKLHAKECGRRTLEKSGCTVWVFRLRNARSPKHSASTLRKPDGAVPQFAFG